MGDVPLNLLVKLVVDPGVLLRRGVDVVSKLVENDGVGFLGLLG